MKMNSQMFLLSALFLGSCLAQVAVSGQEMSETEMLKEMELIEKSMERQFNNGLETFIEENLPEFAMRMEEMEGVVEDESASSREKLLIYREALHMFQAADHYRVLHERYPESAEKLRKQIELEMEAAKIAERYHDLESEEEKAESEQRMREILEKVFEISQSLREQESREIEQELTRIRDSLQLRRENKLLIIDRRLHEMLYGEDPLEW